MPSNPVGGGFEPRTTQAERRDFFDIRRLLTGLQTSVDKINTTLAFLGQELATLYNSFTGEWSYRTGGAEPPGAGNLTSNGPPVTVLYISIEDINGVNRALEMSLTRIGTTIWLRGATPDDYGKYTVTSVAKNGTHFTFGVTQEVQSGTVAQNATITVNFVIPEGGYVNYQYAGDNAATDPGVGFVAIDGTGNNPRTFAANKTDADGLTRNLLRINVGATFSITDDPEALPVTGFAQYAVSSEPQDQGTYVTWTADRLIYNGPAGLPPIGTVLRFYA